MSNDTFKHTTMVVVTARKGESMMDAIERTIKTVREQEEAECRSEENCAEENCGGRPDPRAMRPSDIAEFSEKCKQTPDPRANVKSTFDFGEALYHLRQGEHVARKGWNGRGIFIALQRPNMHSKMTSPYIYIDTTGLRTDNPDAPKSCVPWLASQTDMLAEDWMVLD